MNPGPPSNGANGQPASPGISLDDVYFTLFRHKWLILAFVSLGIIGAAAIRLLRPPPYLSKAELMVLYVNDIKPGITSSNQDETTMPTDPGGEAVLNSEMEILKSLDVAVQVAEQFGPQKILAKLGGGTNLMRAASVIASGIDVEIPARTSILTVSFRHRDPELVQPVLDVLLKTYQRKHIDVREKLGVRDEYYAKERDDLSAKIISIDQDLKTLKSQAKTIIPEDALKFYQGQYSKALDALFDAKRDLAEHQAMMGSVGGGVPTGATNADEMAVPADAMNSYSEIASDLDDNKRHERALIRDGYLDAFPLVQRVRERIATLKKQKSDLEGQYPALKHFVLGGVTGNTNSPGTDLSASLEDIKRLTAKVAVCETIVSNVEAEAARVLDIQPKLLELERKREEDQRKYESMVAQLSMAHGGDAAGQLINMSMVQNPTPPQIDYKKFYKKIGAVLGGCSGMGFALAFLFDLVLDRSIKRSKEVERHLHLPVFLAIPDTSRAGGLRLPWSHSDQGVHAGPATQAGGNSTGADKTAVVKWDSRDPMQFYAEGLRERLMTYFEVHNLNLKKPKLVGVTGCSAGAGVTTLASGLAAELSKTGDGNVLLVDMNVAQGVGHPFYNGKPGCGLAEALEPNARAEAQVQEKLYMASGQPATSDKLTKSMPNRFNNLVPKLKASDYDYIIFDLPPVSPTSATPRLASHMDIVLMVLESEKTGQQLATRATALMREARANVAAVLNKCRRHVPSRLSQDI